MWKKYSSPAEGLTECTLLSVAVFVFLYRVSSVRHEHPTQSALENRSRDSAECHLDVLGCTETKK